MHHSPKTSKPANLLLAFGLTIVTLLSAVGPGYSAPANALAPAPQAAALCASPLPAGIILASGTVATAEAAPSAACDRCRAICARNCASYACIACAQAIKCRSTVQACVSPRRKS